MAELKTYYNGFTLSEIIITLIIIGVVATITIPMLSNDVNDKKWNVGRQKAQATIGEAFKLTIINGYVTSEYENSKEFVTKVLTKYLKINKQCNSAVECGFSSQVKRADGKSQRTLPTSWSNSTTPYVLNGEKGSGWISTNYSNKYGTKFENSTFFQTLDGFSVNFFYNPYCACDEKDIYTKNDGNNYYAYIMDIACMNAVYDMNGKQGPNQVGKDIGFVGAFYNGYGTKVTAVLPYSIERIANNDEMPGSGTNYAKRAMQYCNELHNNNWKMPDVDELSLMHLNKFLLWTSVADKYFWASTPVINSELESWYVHFSNSRSNSAGKGTISGSNAPYGSIRCVRK